MANAVTFRGITKRYPGVTALEDVSFTIEQGSCHALMGENGAGKSTLGKILSGLIQPDAGEIELFGKRVQLKDPLDAISHGVSIVHQELLFCENLTVAENLSLGQTPHRGPWVDWTAMESQARHWLSAVSEDISPDANVGELPLGVQQMVQIAGALGRSARVVVFDEPTSSLSQGEALKLFEQIERLKAQGITCIYVSHRMDEIFRICDTVTVLRDGRHVETRPLAGTSREDLIKLMVGREIDVLEFEPASAGEILLKVENLQSDRFRSATLEVRAGEVLGIAGLVGAGRTELAEALFGLRPSRGRASLLGKDLMGLRPEERMAAGLGFLPEDRKRLGLILSMNVRENTTLSVLRELSRNGFVQTAKEQELASSVNASLRTKTASLESNVQALSGGNQQKVALSKWLAAESKVLILDEPTRGVDVGAKREIHQIIRSLAREGRGILVISSELPELLTVSDRILAMREGSLVSSFDRNDATEENLMASMTGQG